jgi:predicted GIY-YIG superfamily endonuclease
MIYQRLAKVFLIRSIVVLAKARTHNHRLVCVESFASSLEAIAREKQLKIGGATGKSG